MGGCPCETVVLSTSPSVCKVELWGELGAALDFEGIIAPNKSANAPRRKARRRGKAFSASSDGGCGERDCQNFMEASFANLVIFDMPLFIPEKHTKIDRNLCLNAYVTLTK